MSFIRHTLLGDDRGRISIPVNAGLMVALSLLLLLLPNVSLFAAVILLSITLALIVLFIGVIFDDEIVLGRVRLALAGGLVLSCVILSFAGVYYTQSQTRPRAFSVKLSRLAAVYFAVGTMSTDGTHGVEARSSTARAELALQEVVDMTALALLFGGLVWRLGRRARVQHKPGGRGRPAGRMAMRPTPAAPFSTALGQPPRDYLSPTIMQCRHKDVARQRFHIVAASVHSYCSCVTSATTSSHTPISNCNNLKEKR